MLKRGNVGQWPHSLSSHLLLSWHYWSLVHWSLNNVKECCVNAVIPHKFECYPFPSLFCLRLDCFFSDFLCDSSALGPLTLPHDPNVLLSLSDTQSHWNHVQAECWGSQYVRLPSHWDAPSLCPSSGSGWHHLQVSLIHLVFQWNSPTMITWLFELMKLMELKMFDSHSFRYGSKQMKVTKLCDKLCVTDLQSTLAL